MELFRYYFVEVILHRIRSNLEKKIIRGYFSQKASGHRFKNKNSLFIFSTVSWPFFFLPAQQKSLVENCSLVALHIFPMQLKRQPCFLKSHQKLA